MAAISDGISSGTGSFDTLLPKTSPTDLLSEQFEAFATGSAENIDGAMDRPPTGAAMSIDRLGSDESTSPSGFLGVGSGGTLVAAALVDRDETLSSAYAALESATHAADNEAAASEILRDTGGTASAFSRLIADRKLTGTGFERLLRNADPRTLQNANAAIAEANEKGTLPKNFVDDYTNALVHDPAVQFGNVGNALSAQDGTRNAVGDLTPASSRLSAAYASSALSRSEALSPASAADVAATLAGLDPATRTRVLTHASPQSIQTLVQRSLERQAVDPDADGASQLVRSVAAAADSSSKHREIATNVWRGTVEALSNRPTALALGDGREGRSLRADALSLYQAAAPAIRSGMDPADPVSSSQYRAFLRFGTSTSDDISAAYDSQMRIDVKALGVKITLPPMTASEALGNIRRGDDMQYDGNSNFVIRPDADNTAANPEFGKNTTVVFVNGIQTDMARAVVGAQRLADLTGNNVQIIHNGKQDLASDLKVATAQRSNMYRGEGPADQSVRDTILHRVSIDRRGHLQMSGDLHFVAHSKGAISTTNGIDEAKKQLISQGYMADDVDALFGKHITMETFGGAGAVTPSIIKRVDYENTHDFVPLFGVEPVLGNDYVRGATVFAAPSNGSIPLWEGLIDQLRGAPGSGIRVAVAPNHHFDTSSVADNLFAVNHDAPRYFSYRQPFAETYAKGPHTIEQPPFMVAKGSVFPTNDELQDKVDDLARTGTWLPPVKQVSLYRGGQLEGHIIKLDSQTFAINAGKGIYEIVDSKRINGYDEQLPNGSVVSISNMGYLTAVSMNGSQRAGVSR